MEIVMSIVFSTAWPQRCLGVWPDSSGACVERGLHVPVRPRGRESTHAPSTGGRDDRRPGTERAM